MVPWNAASAKNVRLAYGLARFVSRQLALQASAPMRSVANGYLSTASVRFSFVQPPMTFAR
jgi:hypothetical protein